jgi:tetratricopeptide (TPR) repeat protein
MIAVAEGDTDSVLKLTPIDVERHLNKIEQTCRRQRWTLLDRMLLVALIIGLPYLAVATLIDNPQFLLDLRAQIFQFDPQTFVDRSSYFVSQNKLNEALRECEKALAIDPSNSKALQQKSYVLYLFGRYVESLQVNDSSKNKTTTFFWNRERALNALGDNYSAAEASFGAYSAGSSSDGLRKRWDSHKKHDIF